MKHPASSVGELGELPAHPRTEEELKQWIADGVEESLTLDYKAKGALAKEKRGEIAKDVSAMANSAGGVVIYGVSEFPKDSGKQHLPEKIDPIDDPQFTKEWLEHVIAGGVRPRISDLLVHPIRLAGGGAVYVVVVPQG
jgi:predicted HTH transcriptional regulator